MSETRKGRKITDKQVTAKVDANIFALLVMTAEAKGTTIAELIRQILREWYVRVWDDVTKQLVDKPNNDLITPKQIACLESLCKQNGVRPPEGYKKMTKWEAGEYIRELINAD